MLNSNQFDNKTHNTLVLATNNQGKIAEFKEILSPLNLNIITQKDLNLESCEETGLSFVENAIIKARYLAQKTNLPTLADDSGLVIPSLNGQPGIYSARFAGQNATNEENIQKVLDLLKTTSSAQMRQAYFYCCLVFLRYPKDPTPIICHGTFYGIIAKHSSGINGFGYDPIFWLEDYNCTVAELDITIKNKISHRAIALNQMFVELNKLNRLYNV